MAKKKDHIERFANREGVMVSYTVWSDGQGAELMFDAPFQPTRSLSLSASDMGEFVDLLEGMKDAVLRQYIVAERAALEYALRRQLGEGE